MTAILDLSGSVRVREPRICPRMERDWRFDTLSFFMQGYTTAMLKALAAQPHAPAIVRFATINPTTLLRMRRDCERVEPKDEHPIYSAKAGEYFWLDRAAGHLAPAFRPLIPHLTNSGAIIFALPLGAVVGPAAAVHFEEFRRMHESLPSVPKHIADRLPEASPSIRKRAFLHLAKR